MDDENACADCGSTTLEIEDDGLTYCENGHIQNRGLQIGEDEQDFLNRGNTVRKKTEKEKQNVSRVLRGRNAFQLFLQAWQYILWKQCYSLVHDKGLPPELWTVVRDLWALRISKLAPKLENDSRENLQLQGDEDILHPTSSESDTDKTDTEPQLDKVAAKTTKLSTKNPALVETLVLNYLGMLLLRQAVSLSTIIRWVQDETIPFLRAIRYIPTDMKARLPGEYHRALDNITILTPDELQLSVFRVLSMFEASFGMAIPQLNFKPLLMTYIETLALPLGTYVIVDRLRTITDFEFTYLTPRTSRRSAVAYPEAQIMSLVVIATKLLYPFDSDTVEYHPRSLNDPGAISLDWTAWLESRDLKTQASTTSGPSATIQRGTELSLTDTDILSMSESQLDQYMDWYQRTWTKPRQERHDVNQEILDQFPVIQLQDPDKTALDQLARENEKQRQQRTTERLKKVHSKLKAHRPIPDPITTGGDDDGDDDDNSETATSIIRPGARYARFLTPASLVNVSAAARVFHQDAADAACLSLETLLRAVNHTEQMIILWKRAKRRAEVWGEEMDLDAERGIRSSPPVVSGEREM